MFEQPSIVHQTLNSVVAGVRVALVHKRLPQKAKPYALSTLRRAFVPPPPITKEAVGIPNTNFYVSVLCHCSTRYSFGLAWCKRLFVGIQIA